MIEIGRHLAGEWAWGQVGEDAQLDAVEHELLVKIAEIAQIAVRMSCRSRKSFESMLLSSASKC